ncbi:MAG: hypothetical protein HOP07_09680 [Bacteriovoracaceae bacterium]|nr:hypothetical protein [Bacteriovoracaceae bacterium]
MMNKRFLTQSISCALITTSVFGALSYSFERNEPKKIDLNGFKNALTNIEHFSNQNQGLVATRVSKNVTDVIVATIEKEVKKKISASRIKIVKDLALKKSEEKYIVVNKNWNEIKPSFPEATLLVDSVSLVSSAPLSTNEFKQYEINNSEMISLKRFYSEMINIECFASSVIPQLNIENKKDLKEIEANVAVEKDDLDMLGYSKAEPEKNLDSPKFSAAKEALNSEDIVSNDYTTNTEAESVPTSATSYMEASENNNDIEKIEANIAVDMTETEDEVKLTQSAVIANSAPIETRAQVVDEVDDLVMFDYSKAAPKKIFNSPISSTVKEVIKREIHSETVSDSKVNARMNIQNHKLKFETTMDTQALKEAMNNEDRVVYDYTTKSQAAPVPSIENAFMGSLEKNNDVEMTTLKLRAKEINMGTHSVRMATGFEFVPDYERSERVDDQAIGEIKFDYSLEKSMSIQTGVVQSLGNIPTRVEIDLLRSEMTVPLINEEGIQKYLEKRSLNIVGSLIMVAIDESIQDVELDREYQGKIYLNKNFKTLPSGSGASYIMILGVSPGNVMLRYLLSNNESSQKIIYLGDGEMYYEDPIFKEGKREVYNFSTRSLLGKKVKELNIQADKVGFFGAKVSSKKKALSAYEINVPTIVENERKYLEFKHLDSTLYVGTQNVNEIEVPGQDFINKVLEQKDMKNLGQRCLIQINLSKDIRDVKANGKNKQGEMFVELNYLDNDGNFSNETPELAEKIFIGGDQEGLIGIRVDYTDGSTGFLKSYCSEGSYLVEQL